MNGVFITGSNTEVGKTTVSVEIIKRLRKKRQIVVRKPVETDCELVDGAYVPEDAIKLNEACASGERIEVVCPFCFEFEASPEEASLQAERPLELVDLVRACQANVGEHLLGMPSQGQQAPVAAQREDWPLQGLLQAHNKKGKLPLYSLQRHRPH